MKISASRPRDFVRCILACAAVTLALHAPADAGPVSYQGFADLSPAQADGSFTGDINTATTFTLGKLTTTTSADGYFLGLFSGTNRQMFSPITFSVNSPTSFAFGNPFFGYFSSTSILELSNTPGARSFSILGDYSGGTRGGLTSPNPAAAKFVLSITQTPAGSGGAISDSATLEFVAVPEPASVMLAGAGILGAVAIASRRRLACGRSPKHLVN